MTQCNVSGNLDCKEFARNAGDLGLIPGLGRSLGEENGNSLQYFCLENSTDKSLRLVGYRPWYWEKICTSGISFKSNRFEHYFKYVE